ncbi:hypothetical protein EXS70_03620 [Candidatus Peribacteria bacterium]|nr:hypothetical protein [Candidatus Peribacteria bacterium]
MVDEGTDTNLAVGDDNWQDVGDSTLIPLPNQEFAALARGIAIPAAVLQKVFLVCPQGIISTPVNGHGRLQEHSLADLSAYLGQLEGVDLMQGETLRRAENVRTLLRELGVEV